MEVFNAPTREVCTVRRERTNTPVQALVTLNDPQFVEAACRLAEAVLKERAEPSAAIAEIARRVLLRPLSGAETEVVMQTAGHLQQQFTANPPASRGQVAYTLQEKLCDLDALRSYRKRQFDAVVMMH
jgi:hypothetical protein